MRKLALIVMLFLLVGCAIQRQGEILLGMPQDVDNDAPQVVVIRELATFLSGQLVTVHWDELKVFTLGAGEYSEFHVQPGTHTFKVSSGVVIGSPQSMEFERGKTYYLMISPFFNPLIVFLSNFEIEVINNIEVVNSKEELTSTYRNLGMQ